MDAPLFSTGEVLSNEITDALWTKLRSYNFILKDVRIYGVSGELGSDRIRFVVYTYLVGSKVNAGLQNWKQDQLSNSWWEMIRDVEEGVDVWEI